MNCQFRSHLMQQFAASARTQSRPPLALFSAGSEEARSTSRNASSPQSRPTSSSPPPPPPPPRSLSRRSIQLSSIHSSSFHQQSFSSSVVQSSMEEEPSKNDEAAACTDNEDITSDETHHVQPSPSAQHFQQLISSRRTVSNFLTNPKSLSSESHDEIILSDTANQQFLRDAIHRAVECAITAPNHKITEPTTFHQILAPSAATEKLLDVAYGVTLERLRSNKLSGDEACRSEAMRKREKWSNIPAFVVATVGGMGDQCSLTYDESDATEIYKELPFIAPSSTRQLEDYASACASVQNLLLSLHSEGLGSKWATGPVIRTRAFRNLIGCGSDDVVVGLIMIGFPKRVPRMPRRRRDLVGDILKDVKP